MDEEMRAVAEKTPRTARGRETLRRLLDAAADEFEERGYHDAAISGITARAGVALGTFYTYFTRKEELYRALVRDMSRRTRQHVAMHAEGAPNRLEAERRGLEAFIGFVRQNKRLYRIIEESQFAAEDVYHEHYQSFVEGYMRNLAAARARGEIRDGRDELRAWALIGMSVFLGLRYGVWQEDLTPTQIADAAVDLIAHGLAPTG